MSEILLVNPRRRRRKKTTVKRRKTRARKSNPVKRRRRRASTVRRRRRSNPRLTARSVQNQVMDALQGATGALALDVTLGYLPIPANLKAGLVGTGVKALLAIGIGVLGQNFKIVKPSTAAKLSNGALTVVLHDELKKQVQNFMPNIPMGEYLNDNYVNNSLGYYGSGYNPGPYLPDMGTGMEESGFGEYLDESGEYIDDYSIA